MNRFIRVMFKKLVLVFLCFISLQYMSAQTELLTNFPEGYEPEVIGKRMAYHFIDGKHLLHVGKWISYPETFTWNGALNFGDVTGDKELIRLLQNRFEPLFTTEKALLPIMNHVDVNMFGSLPLTLYRITGERRYYDLGMPYADTQWQLPINANEKEKEWADKGYSWQSRLWIDDMYMITIVQTLAYKVTGDRKYVDRAAKEMVLYLDELQRPNGLFYHAPDVPYYWGRGNGWMAAGMTELLRCLPENSEYRPRIMKGYRKMMESLKKYQTEEGMWRQLLDQPDCWIETSGSAMFTYAMIEGIKNDWLDSEEYAPIARKAWMGMVTYVNENGDVRNVCTGTNKKNDKQYYYDRKRNVGDYHGQAPYLWCAVALSELNK